MDSDELGRVSSPFTSSTQDPKEPRCAIDWNEENVNVGFLFAFFCVFHGLDVRWRQVIKVVLYYLNALNSFFPLLLFAGTQREDSKGPSRRPWIL